MVLEVGEAYKNLKKDQFKRKTELKNKELLSL